MLRVADGELERIDFDGDTFDREDRRSVFAGGNGVDSLYNLHEHCLTA